MGLMADIQSVDKNAVPKTGATNAAVVNPTKKRKGGPGRPKGSQNRLTVQVKEAILQAFEEAGGTCLKTVYEGWFLFEQKGNDV